MAYDPTTDAIQASARRKLDTLARLMPETVEALRFRGHNVEGLRWQTPGAFLREWTCPDCGMSVHLDPAPPPNGIDVGGEAVALHCTGVLLHLDDVLASFLETALWTASLDDLSADDLPEHERGLARDAVRHAHTLSECDDLDLWLHDHNPENADERED